MLPLGVTLAKRPVLSLDGSQEREELHEFCSIFWETYFTEVKPGKFGYR